MGGRTVNDRNDVRQQLAGADRTFDWTRVRAVIAGLGTSGYASADALLELGAQVTVVDDAIDEGHRDKGGLLEVLGATVHLGPGSTASLPQDTDLVIVSPGWRPLQPLVAEALATGIPVWGEPELAWRLMHPDHVIPWLAVTGTNGKTTTTQMTEAILKADGLRAAAVGNIGRPILEAMADEVDYQVFAVELSSFQLHWSSSLSLHSAAVLNLHQDHLEWYADHPDPFAAYGADKAKIFHRVQHSCVYNVADPATERMVEQADVVEGARAIGFTLGTPGPSMVGVVDDRIVDRAFLEQRQSSAIELAKLSDVHPFAPHNVENALAAAALTRSFGVHPRAVAQGLRDLHLGGHRIETVHQAGGLTWVDDSKATNPHAANSSMRAYDHIVWIAGGQAKGTDFDHLVTTHRDKLRGAVVIGIDRKMIAETLARLAPQVPVVVLDSTDRSVMAEAVHRAAEMAQAGDTVLMAPGCASLDIWPGYAARGDDFAKAARTIDGPVRR
ncbi:UDP-N-acetylmuramoyl-L-alanine--D-glutamate ligase [Acidipropionibacterium jensenii]|uniref:UDP-N-acetylmuramoyl-L-alanine--D-glutamate ligase n=1 Tax=Acidipropionibacterium jensenii TaxID=1749 RepID=UPI002647116B|nr:UDP-N-acetylmuramoyl-L-alanine--D-glutamate ligase [Acidipropionibacterium jensenii]MDN5995226.1 UDP-N-acetylmuramoyl-L-alanine--D-glutamate ligase [Acidipropionibacterium jensenii]